MTTIMEHAEITAAVECARETLAKYNDRDGLTGNPDWDLVMAAKMSANLEQLVALVEKLASR